VAFGPDSQQDLVDDTATSSTCWESVPSVHDGRRRANGQHCRGLSTSRLPTGIVRPPAEWRTMMAYGPRGTSTLTCEKCGAKPLYTVIGFPERETHTVKCPSCKDILFQEKCNFEYALVGGLLSDGTPIDPATMPDPQ
jgi:hypothetical protein